MEKSSRKDLNNAYAGLLLCGSKIQSRPSLWREKQVTTTTGEVFTPGLGAADEGSCACSSLQNHRHCRKVWGGKAGREGLLGEPGCTLPRP